MKSSTGRWVSGSGVRGTPLKCAPYPLVRLTLDGKEIDKFSVDHYISM